MLSCGKYPLLLGLVVFFLLIGYIGLKMNTVGTSKQQILPILPPQTWTSKDSMESIDIFNRESVKPKNILYWTPFRRAKDFSFGIGQNPFILAKCEVFNCVTTNSKDNLSEADALIFHIPQFKISDIPALRYPHQRYAFFVRECPAHRKLRNLERFNNFFNMTITYSRQADVGAPYGRIGKRGEVPYNAYNESIVQTKTKFALAIISHCETESERENVIKALKDYIDIDVLGRCDKSDRPTRNCERSFKISCINTIISEYKFYFSFESYLCKDYASEKLYKVLDLPVIPVVYGGSNYSELLPPKSFIDVRDFKTAASLAAYLKDVASSTDKFLSYFAWRKDFRQTVDIEMKRTKFIKLDPRVMCDLCKYLHINSNKTKVIPDMPAVYGRDKYCFSPGNWLKTFVAKS